MFYSYAPVLAILKQSNLEAYIKKKKKKNSLTLFSNPNTSRTMISYFKPRTKTSGSCFGEVIQRPTTTIQLVIDFQSPPH